MDEVLVPVHHLSSVFLMDGSKSKCRKIFIFIVLSVIIGSVVIRQIIKPLYAKRGIIIVSVDYAHYNLQIPTIISCLISTNRNQEIITEFLATIKNLDKKFKNLGFSTNYTPTKKLTGTLTVYTTLKVLLQQIPFILRGFQSIDILLDYIVFNIPLFFIYVLIIQWITYLTILRLCFRTLTTIVKTKCHKKWDIIENYRSWTYATKPQVLRNLIRTSGVIYNDLCVQGGRINKAFAMQFLCMIPTLFLAVIFCSFQSCRMFKKEIDLDCGFIIFDGLYFLVFLEMVVPCVEVREEMDSFVEELQRINLKEIDDAVNTVILQAHYQKIDFSACGILPLDATLIYSITGAVTTYLIMLLQFDL